VVLRVCPVGLVEPDPAATDLARWLVLAADDCLTLAAQVSSDAEILLGVRDLVGLLPCGADRRAGIEAQGGAR